MKKCIVFYLAYEGILKKFLGNASYDKTMNEAPNFLSPN